MPDPEADLVPADVATFTGGRLSEDDSQVVTLLAAALADARTFCGWPVCPAREETITLDGPCSPLLVLPTLHMTALAEVTEDGVAVDVDTLVWSRRGLVRKKSGAWWSGQFGAITVKFTHGYSIAEAGGWRAAVLSCVDRRAIDRGRADQPTKVGPFEWSAPFDGMFSGAERAALEQFRLERPA